MQSYVLSGVTVFYKFQKNFKFRLSAIQECFGVQYVLRFGPGIDYALGLLINALHRRAVHHRSPNVDEGTSCLPVHQLP